MLKKKETVDIIIETPKGCRNKYAYDEEVKAFRLKKILPVGAVFPFDFGFIPDTKGEDGDPLDVLVIMNEPAYPGCVVECRIIGALKAKQTERHGKVEENDRLIAVSIVSTSYSEVRSLKDINKNILDEIEHFFISYNQQAGKKFEPGGWANAKEAMLLIEKAK
ncbi:MAG TPA: inorganic diphosphatase [Flavisolibacter sp.]|nr:inorganic diphosphatase [Flavisolibacter sp.]